MNDLVIRQAKMWKLKKPIKIGFMIPFVCISSIMSLAIWVGYTSAKFIILNYSSTHYSERKLSVFSRNCLLKELCVYSA